jgi:hypothetical protein
MRNRNLISMIYANLEKSSEAAERAAQINPRLYTPADGRGCERWGQPCVTVHDEQKFGLPRTCGIQIK